MKPTRSAFWYPGPMPAYPTVDTLKVTAIMLSAIFTLLVVLSYPTAAGGAVLMLLVAGVIARRARRRQGGRSLRETLTPVSNAFARNLKHVRRPVRRV